MKLFEIELHDNEKMLRKVRQHWILLLWPTWRSLLLVGLGAWGANYFNAFSGDPLPFLLFLCFVMLVFNSWFHSFLNWYLNIYFITNKRIINVTHESIFRRQTTEAPLNRVQDVTHKTLGFISMLFNYGDVIIQTAGHQTLIHFSMVPYPREIHKEIVSLLAHEHLQGLAHYSSSYPNAQNHSV